ncbi:SDR family NAD(P)-dependent oxidoreductase [Micromonospora sp. KC207]|uniref:SDR family NAD(P)-dependent oxidoreductase n=1 Tax=Micromonospora carbonacea TaxID=47853 RepID=A0A7D6C6Q1_9ACTN|nr:MULTISPECIES: SDR family NAD(P)-dependent oxidoreductase [unclassified Micromonospora]QLJ99186.1 SDR family NAD(P)-dependent oxidoreductase [Micromonospora carbonacea]TDC66759.1 SDR family NAD(P)-dependent oxidoreductase [Micromonospora sp. KC207]
MEDLTGRRIVVVTGASSGIGLAAAVDLARRGDEVVLVGRDPARLRAAGERVREASGERPELFRADFAVLDDVRGLAERLRAAYDRIDVLANNAGAIVLRPVTTVDGFELSMQANHLAPFLLSTLLRDRVGRLVVTASGAHRSGALDPDDLNAALRDYGRIRAYGTSKQANILFTAEAARRWPDIPAYCFHPGVVRTRFGADSPLVAFGLRVLPFRSPEKGAETLVWLANQDPARLVDGGYYSDRRLRRPMRKASDPQLAARLWTASAKAVGVEP